MNQRQTRTCEDFQEVIKEDSCLHYKRRYMSAPRLVISGNLVQLAYQTRLGLTHSKGHSFCTEVVTLSQAQGRLTNIEGSAC